MIIKPTQGPICPQTSRSILNWLMDKAHPVPDGTRYFTRYFSGRLPHEAVVKLVRVVNAAHDVTQTSHHFKDCDLHIYSFTLDHTIKGEFLVSVTKSKQRKAGDKYQVELGYRLFSLEELLKMRGMQ